MTLLLVHFNEDKAGKVDSKAKRDFFQAVDVDPDLSDRLNFENARGLRAVGRTNAMEELLEKYFPGKKIEQVPSPQVTVFNFK